MDSHRYEAPRSGMRSIRGVIATALAAGGLALAGCAAEEPGGHQSVSPASTISAVTPTATATATAPASTTVWRPRVGTTWQWQLTGTIDQSVNAEVYDVDGFDVTAATVASLHAKGRKVVCYINVGAWENWRSDAASFPTVVRGRSNGWSGEKWLDIRRTDLLGPTMAKRFDMCRSKGFDAVEPDNVDGYANRTGFPLTAAQQVTYNKLIAELAHARGMSVALKNDVEQVAALQPFFDFAVNEECFAYRECAELTPFITAGKAVLHVEYSGSTTAFCPTTTKLGFSSMLKKLDLTAWRQPC